MHALLGAAYRSLTGREPPRRPVPGGPSIWRMLAEEIALAVRAVVHPVQMGSAAIVVLAVGVLLGPTTPGPVLGVGPLLAVVTLVGLLGLAVAHRLLQRVPEQPALLRGPVVVLASATIVVVGTAVVAYLTAIVTGADPTAEGEGLTASLPVDGTLLIGAALLVLGVLVAGVTNRVAVPASLLFLATGMALGDDGVGMVSLQDPVLVQSLGVIALVVILHDGGLSTTPDRLRLGLGPGLALATLGVGITAGVTAVATMWLVDAPPRVAWLIGAIVASTDASAVFSLLRQVRVPPRLSALLEAESGTNDPVTVLLTVGLVSSWQAPPAAVDWLTFGVLQLIGGLCFGVAGGWASSLLLRRGGVRAPGLLPVLTVGMAGLTYGLTTTVGASGFLAVYVSGLVVAADPRLDQATIRPFVDALSRAAEIGLFLLLGLLVFPSQLPAIAGTAVVVAVVLITVARPAAVVLSLVWFGVTRREMVAVSWLGMRGAVPIVLATLAFSAGIPEAPLIFDVVFFVVVLTTVLQGLTALPVVRALRLSDPTPPSPERHDSPTPVG